MEDFQIRSADQTDASLVLFFIRQLAEYERLTSAVSATEQMVLDNLLGPDSVAEVLLGYYKGAPVAFAVFFHNFSTFLAQRGIYLEDLFVLPDMRGRGFGKAMLKRLAEIAVERRCGRFEWAVLDWNKEAIGFYKRLGAVPMEEWTTFRLEGDSLKNLAASE